MKCDAFMNAVQSALCRGTSPDIQILIGDQALDVDHVENAEDDEGTIMAVAYAFDPLDQLKLIVVYWEGDAELWSLALKKVICTAVNCDNMRAFTRIPDLHIDASFEADVVRWKGYRYDGSAPRHDEVFEYLEAHPNVISQAKGKP